MAGEKRPTKYKKQRFSHHARDVVEQEVVATQDKPVNTVPGPSDKEKSASGQRDKKPPRRAKERKEGKGLGAFLNFSKKDKSQENDKTKDKTSIKPKRNKPQRGRKTEPEVAQESRPTEPVKKEPQKETKVQSYLGLEFLEIPEVVEEDMYLKVLLKTVRKRNTLGAINLVPLDKVAQEIEDMVSEYNYRRGGLDDMLTEDEDGFEEVTVKDRTHKREGKVNVL